MDKNFTKTEDDAQMASWLPASIAFMSLFTLLFMLFNQNEPTPNMWNYFAAGALSTLSYWLNKKSNKIAQFTSKIIFCSVLFYVFVRLFFISGGFESPASVYLVLLPLFIRVFVHKTFSRLTLVVVVITFAIEAYCHFVLGISFKSQAIDNQYLLGLINISFTLIVCYSLIHSIDIWHKKSIEKDLFIINKQKMLIAQKDTFLSNMSHELRTPLNGIYGALQIVEGNDETEKAVLKAAKSSAEALNRIVSDILDIQKLSNGKLEITPQWNVSAPLLIQVQNLFTQVANNKKIAFTVTMDESIPLELYCDEVRFGQILNNIVGNAIKFTEHGSVTLNAHYEDNHLIIEVSDTGIGMDEVALSHLFERFTQADSSLRKKYAGTGLGMAITKELVELMNGTIEVTSELGKGTTFTVKIPLEGRGTTLVEKPKSSTIQNKKTEDIRILLIDDDSTNRLIGKTMLEKRYQHVDTAEDGAEALAKVNNGTYDIIITDIQMPIMNGEELLEKLKVTHPHLPVIALTGNAYEHDTESYLANGFVAVETKPFNTASLLRTIENTLS